MENIFKYLVVSFKGICMGAADVIPGVSGGTIAFLMGIYQTLIDSIKAITINFRLLLKGRIGAFLKAINAKFLCSLILGILISIFSLARLMEYLLIHHPIELWSFFFGLIFLSSFMVLREIDKWNFTNILFLIIGIVVAGYICLISPSQTPETYWFIFLSGAIAICAMILPGISGSFILLLLGKYAFIMEAVTDLNLPILITFACGAIIGILAFSHFLGWLLKKFYMPTIAALSGFMIGSLIKVWPWKVVVAGDAENAALTVDRPVWPGHFEAANGIPAELGGAVIFALVGIELVVILELSLKYKKKSEDTEQVAKTE